MTISTTVQNPLRLFVGGEWLKPESDATIDVHESHTGQLHTTVAEASTKDVDIAVAAARRAFDEGPWPRLSAAERASYLNKLADALESRSEQLARQTTLQNGGLLAMTQGVNTPWGVHALRYYADLVVNSDASEDRDCMNANATINKLPVGVVAAIVPWNVSFIAAMSKIAPALAAGCTLIHKPSPETPLEAYVIAEAAEEAGLPPGVFNVVVADREASEHLVSHDGVDQVSFTGSTAVGSQIAAICAGNVKRCSMELGGNAAAIVLEDMPMQAVIPGLLGTSALLNNGQACIAQSRILVPRSQYDDYVAALSAAANGVQVGDPNEMTTQLGPMVSARHMETILSYIELARSEGATIAAGGNRKQDLPEPLSGGWFIEPTVIADADNKMRICQEEIFGPVVKVLAYESEAEAVAMANDQPYGLSSSVWSTNPEKAAVLASQLMAGSVYVNGAMTIDINVPFGGLKKSGLGAECGPEGLGEYLINQVIFTPKPAAAG
ncbi:MAG: aldehyde dehydrogenase [Gammaproteobacteria bacterium]|nr:aldehyde dehydrogenase [Gammaproteobacteria bacterium]